MKLRRLVMAATVLGALSARAAIIDVAVSVAPQAALVEAVGGPWVQVHVAVPDGASPHVFDPTPREVATLAGARLYVATGVEVELQLLPRLRAMVPDLMVIGPVATVDPHAGHDHTVDCSHHDPHLWLDPRLASDQVGEVAVALADLLPAHADQIAERAAAEQARLAALHDDLAAILAPVRGRDMVVAHPAYGRLAAAYGLEQVAVEHDGREPSPRQLAQVLQRVRDRGATALFVQPQFSMSAARGLAEAAGVSLVVLDPLARDYHDNMRTMARTIAEVLSEVAVRP